MNEKYQAWKKSMQTPEAKQLRGMFLLTLVLIGTILLRDNFVAIMNWGK